MTINPRRSGHILLVFIAIIAFAAIVFIGWQLIKAIQKIDLNHGFKTNDVDITWSGTIQDIETNYPGVTTALASVDGQVVEVSLESLRYTWYYTVQSSTNLRDWSNETLTWAEAQADIQANHELPCKFYRRLVVW